MAHDCLRYWGAPARRLTVLLDGETLRQRRSAVSAGSRNRRVRPARPYEGWVHRASRAADYDSLITLYFELCLAIKQSTDFPNHHGASAIGGRGRAVDAARMGDLARSVLRGLERDGRDRTGGVWAHHEFGVPRYGTPNWLEEPPARRGPGRRQRPRLEIARELLRALRAAVDR